MRWLSRPPNIVYPMRSAIVGHLALSQRAGCGKPGADLSRPACPTRVVARYRRGLAVVMTSAAIAQLGTAA